MLDQSKRKQQLKEAMEVARERTLWLLNQVPDEFLKRRVHSFYSPIGWHFGHIGRTEEFWIVSEALKKPVLDEHYTFLFADLPENPKENRVNLPTREEIVDYLRRTREHSFTLLEGTDLAGNDPYLADGYAWEFALQHECQHQETIAEMMQLINQCIELDEPETWHEWKPAVQARWIDIPGGSFTMGSNHRHGYDNEKREHEVLVESFRLASLPVTAYEWSGFIEDGGYSRRELWSEEGWSWREMEEAVMPEYWRKLQNGFAFCSPRGLRSIHPDEPVSCVSWFEADAYARWKGARLPTEAEWEYAARGPLALTYPWGSQLALPDEANYGLHAWGPQPVGNRPKSKSPFGVEEMAGNVWEWTSSPFLPYPGFEAFPYDGYSKDHMKGEHRVCRGGSWATAAPLLRCTFRNWYVPSYRQGFLGLRLAL